ncbi:bifunctional Macro domain/Macro domain-like/CRAL-TRIO lipid binding domain superfamily [Babesia duncani]|uniref:Bifunctional Macro domain/Macro domain-like/CRAL-TRIO lipid binding domain superfamily n=1 Tax=Babesia duncani TaxID=323732 RepID=A0AAD9PMZ7_9APIC|nr:bifunctional Macro domain/Macro domain-like/CRAL-TRIO lipid binding domain superfamily [Babesia duncani]
MNEDITSGIAGALDWIVGEIGQFVEVEFAEPLNEPSVTPITRISQDAIPCWTEYKHSGTSDSPIARELPPKFQIHDAINSKIFITDCDPLALEVGCFVAFLDELNKHKSKIALRIERYCGRRLAYEEVEALRCGEILCSRSYNIGSDYVIYAIAPRHSEKYPEASANILNMCVREALKTMIDAGVTTIAFPMSSESELSYPKCDFVNTLLRTLRKWLELPAVASKVQKIFLIGKMTEFYPLVRRYFPRNTNDETLSAEIATTGNEFGELVYEERNIRVSHGPLLQDVAVPKKAPLANFGKDRQGQNDDQYDHYLKLAYSLKRMDIYKELESGNFVYKCGNDDANRPVILFDAYNFTFAQQHNYALAYALATCNRFLQEKFVVVLANLGKFSIQFTYPDASLVKAAGLLVLFRDLCQVLGPTRIQCMGAVYFHRCSWAIKSFAYLVSGLLPDEVWQASIFVGSVGVRWLSIQNPQELGQHLPLKSLVFHQPLL